jgi:hypothetical protein
MFVSKYAPRGAPDRARLEQLASEGAPLREIALSLDRSVATVRYWLRRWGITRRDSRLTRADPATAPREVMRVCRRHTRAVFRLDRRGTYRCVLCAQERVAERRRRIKRILVEEAGGRCAAADMTARQQPCTSITSIPKRSRSGSPPAASAMELSEPEKKPESVCSYAGTATQRSRRAYVCLRLPGVDSNHQELINSQSCCRYITGERRCRA